MKAGLESEKIAILVAVAGLSTGSRVVVSAAGNGVSNRVGLRRLGRYIPRTHVPRVVVGDG